MADARQKRQTVIFNAKIQPRSKKNEISVLGGPGDFLLKVKLTAPPVDGAANKALVEFLSETLGLKYRDVEIISGKTGRNKLIRASGISQNEFKRKIKNV